MASPETAPAAAADGTPEDALLAATESDATAPGEADEGASTAPTTSVAPILDKDASGRLLAAVAGIYSAAETAVMEAQAAAGPFLSFGQKARIRALAIDFETHRLHQASGNLASAPAVARMETPVIAGVELSREEIEQIVSHRVEIGVQEALQGLGVAADAPLNEQVEKQVDDQMTAQEHRVLDNVREQLARSLDSMESRLQDRIFELVEGEAGNESESRHEEEARAEADAVAEEAREKLLSEVRTVDVGFDLMDYASQIAEVVSGVHHDSAELDGAVMAGSDDEDSGAGDSDGESADDGNDDDIDALIIGDEDEDDEEEAVIIGGDEDDGDAEELELEPAEDAVELELDLDLAPDGDDGADAAATDVGALIALSNDDDAAADLVELGAADGEDTVIGPSSTPDEEVGLDLTNALADAGDYADALELEAGEMEADEDEDDDEDEESGPSLPAGAVEISYAGDDDVLEVVVGGEEDYQDDEDFQSAPPRPPPPKSPSEESGEIEIVDEDGTVGDEIDLDSADLEFATSELEAGERPSGAVELEFSDDDDDDDEEDAGADGGVELDLGDMDDGIAVDLDGLGDNPLGDGFVIEGDSAAPVDLSDDESLVDISIDAGESEEFGELELSGGQLDTAQLEELSLIETGNTGLDTETELQSALEVELPEDDGTGLETLGQGPEDLQISPINLADGYDMDVADALSSFDDAQQEDGESISAMLIEAAELRGKQRNDDAMDVYDRVLSQDSNNFEAHVGLGVLHFEAKDYKSAVDEFTRAEEIDPMKPAASFGLAEVHFHRKQFAKAIKHYDRCLELEDDLAKAYCNRGLSYYYQKNYKKAFLNLMRAYDLDPDLPNIKKYLKLVRNKVKSEKK